MPEIIRFKRGATAGVIPSGLTYGEPAVNVTDRILYIGGTTGETISLAFSGPTGPTGPVGDYVISINGATGAITNVAKTNVAQTFTQLQGFSAGISAYYLETSDNGLVITDFLQGKSNDDISVIGTPDAFSGLYTKGTQFEEITTVWAGSNYDSDTITTAKINLTNSDINNKTQINLKVINYDGNNDIGVTAALIVLSNPYAQDNLVNGKIELYSTDTTTIESANGLMVLSGATFTGNIYAPNIVNSFNGSTGTVGITSGKNISLTQSGQTLTIGISSARPGDTGAIQFNDGSGGLSASTLFNYTTSSGTLRVGGANRFLTLYNTATYNVVANNGAATLCLVAPGSGVYMGDPLIGASGTYVLVDSSPVDTVTIRAATTSLTRANATIGASNDNGYLKLQAIGGLFSSTGIPTIILQDADTDLSGIPYISIFPSSLGVPNFLYLGTAGTNTTVSGTAVTFTPRSTHTGGLTTANLYVSSGATFASTTSTTGLATFSAGLTTANLYVSSGATFASAPASDGGYRITSNAINSRTGTTYTLLASDNGKVITWNATSGSTLTVPSGLSVGFNTTLISIGTGSIGITGSGVTLNSFESKLRIAGQHAAVSIISYSSNIFNIAGGLTG